MAWLQPVGAEWRILCAKCTTAAMQVHEDPVRSMRKIMCKMRQELTDYMRATDADEKARVKGDILGHIETVQEVLGEPGSCPAASQDLGEIEAWLAANTNIGDSPTPAVALPNEDANVVVASIRLKFQELTTLSQMIFASMINTSQRSRHPSVESHFQEAVDNSDARGETISFKKQLQRVV